MHASITKYLKGDVINTRTKCERNSNNIGSNSHTQRERKPQTTKEFLFNEHLRESITKGVYFVIALILHRSHLLITYTPEYSTQ